MGDDRVSCARCGFPTPKVAAINNVWYCHPDDPSKPDCYSLLSQAGVGTSRWLAVGDDQDDLVQQLADLIYPYVEGEREAAIRAVLDSPLLTPVQPLRELADEWDPGIPMAANWHSEGLRQCAAELREKLPPNE